MINGDEKFEKLWAKPRLNSSNRFIVTVVHLIWQFVFFWWHGKDEINLPMLHWLIVVLLTKIIDSNDDDIHYLCFVDLIDSNWIFFSLFTFKFYQILTRWLPGLYHFKSINDDDDWLSSKTLQVISIKLIFLLLLNHHIKIEPQQQQQQCLNWNLIYKFFQFVCLFVDCWLLVAGGLYVCQKILICLSKKKNSNWFNFFSREETTRTKI